MPSEVVADSPGYLGASGSLPRYAEMRYEAGRAAESNAVVSGD